MSSTKAREPVKVDAQHQPLMSPVLDAKHLMAPDWVRWFTSVITYIKSTLNKYDGNVSGVATLVAGTVTVSNARLTANSKLRMTGLNLSGTPGTLYTANLILRVLPELSSFDIVSTNIADTRNIFYEIVEVF